MGKYRRVVLDVLKPHEPPMREFTSAISDIESVEGVNSVLLENDEDVENVKFTVKGAGFSFESIPSKVEELGGSVHSVDEVVCGSETVEQGKTPQDG